jgi:hypothetical protein
MSTVRQDVFNPDVLGKCERLLEASEVIVGNDALTEGFTTGCSGSGPEVFPAQSERNCRAGVDESCAELVIEVESRRIRLPIGIIGLHHGG